MEEIRKIVREVLSEQMDVNNFDNAPEEEYQDELDRLQIDKFADLIGHTVYYVKKVYGEHKVLEWDPDRAQYLLFTEGEKVMASPFAITRAYDNEERTTDVELRWVIRRICSEKDVNSIDIKHKEVSDKGSMIVSFDIITEERGGMMQKVTVLYEDITLELVVDNGKLKTYPETIDGPQTILKTSDKETTGGRWTQYAPFLSRNVHTTRDDYRRMAKIIDKLTFEMI